MKNEKEKQICWYLFMKISMWKPLKHEDTLQINCTRFDLHIHNGTDTCDKCEPGQVIASKEPGILCKSGQVIV
jgi:hypothetical protein